jgi:hypothetical protein
MTDSKMALDGYSKPSTLTEGYRRKGGSNTATSQIQTRPEPPAPIPPAPPQGTENGSLVQGGGGKLEK